MDLNYQIASKVLFRRIYFRLKPVRTLRICRAQNYLTWRMVHRFQGPLWQVAKAHFEEHRRLILGEP